MSEPSTENKALAQAIIKRFGGQPTVQNYYDDDRSNQIPILYTQDAPDEGLLSISTLTLSDHQTFGENNKPLKFGIELITAIEDDARDVIAAMSTCAFNVIKDGMRIYPGAVHPRVFDLYEGVSDTMRHCFFVDPFLWDDKFASMKLETKTVAFLQMVPISDTEYEFVRDAGADALEDIFEQNQIDVFDINREPVL